MYIHICMMVSIDLWTVATECVCCWLSNAAVLQPFLFGTEVVCTAAVCSQLAAAPCDANTVEQLECRLW
jgi:hypothetical protein